MQEKNGQETEPTPGRGNSKGSKKTQFDGTKPGPGRPIGSTAFKTIMDEAGITIESEADRILLIYSVANNPKHRFYAWANDHITERRYGKVTQPIAGSDGSAIEVIVRHVRKDTDAPDRD